MREYSRRDARRGRARRSCSRTRATSPGTLRRRRPSTATLEQVLGGLRRARPASALNRCFYLSTAPAFFPVIVEPARRARACDRHEGAEVRVDDREAVRHDARRGARSSTARCSSVFDESAGLPHRPLPRQGDGPEHAGVPVRQRHVRAAVEPQLHRPRADHGRRGRRRSAPAPATTTAPARCATWSRTTCSSCSATWRWSRRSTSPPTRCATRRSRCCTRSAAPDARGGRRASRCARSTRPGIVGRRGRARLPRGGGRPAGLARPRPTPRCAWRSTTGAGRACRSTCAPASASRARSPRSR